MAHQANYEPGYGRVWHVRVGDWLHEAARSAIGPADEKAQRQDVLRRTVLAPVIIAIVPIEQFHFAGWPAIVSACSAALLYNLLLGYLVFVKKQAFAARLLAFVFDAALLSVASVFVLRALGAANSSSDIWLAFLVFVVSGGFTLAPAGSLIYTSLAMGWFTFGTLMFFPPESQFREELLVRLVFFATFGLVSLGMASELQKRRSRLEQQNRQTIGMLATLVEARDTDAGAHLHRIQHFSRALALHLGFSERDAQEVAYASMLHDVGKANVPDAILKKPGPLTPDEWRIMQDHTNQGDHLLTENSDFEMARQVARWHHEHWDGTGYPDRLKGEQIPLAARIVGVADVYDALISTRPYKEPWPPETAIRELRLLAGSHLDARLVDAFIQLWEAGVIERITQEMGDASSDGQAPIERAA